MRDGFGEILHPGEKSIPKAHYDKFCEMPKEFGISL